MRLWELSLAMAAAMLLTLSLLASMHNARTARQCSERGGQPALDAQQRTICLQPQALKT